MAIYDMAQAIRQPDASNFSTGFKTGQEIAQNRRTNQARNALSRLLQGDASAEADLAAADPAAFQEWQAKKEADGVKSALAGFGSPARVEWEPQGNPVSNSLAALSQPSFNMMAPQQPAQNSLASLVPQGKSIPGSYDFNAAAQFLASKGMAGDAKSYMDMAKAGRPDSVEAFGSVIWKGSTPYQLTKNGQLIALGDGFDVPTRTIDTGTGVVVVPTKGRPIPVATFDKGIDPATAYSQVKQDQRLERGAELDVEVAASKKRAEAAVDREKDVAEQLRGADEAIADLTTLEGALSRLPSPAALKIESAKGFFGRGDPKVQEALGQASVISGRMLKYVERLPGAATDKDREVFMASAGVLTNEDLPVERRVAAARAAKEAYSRLMRKYGQQSDQKPAQGGQSKPQGVGKAALWLKSRNIKTQQEAAAAVKQLQSQGWSRQQIEQALDQAGL